MINKALTSLGASGAIADLAALKSILPDTGHSNTEKPDTGSKETSITLQGATTATTNKNNGIADATATSDEATPAATSAPPQIFKATYSGVPVFEMICRGVAVMRRRSDSYLNATQILKVAEFDKPQRTRILEREVQKGEHEKVQGGYGKYQGTWVPYERGVQLCQEYNVMDVLQPLLGYEIRANSPPLAPKHVTAATNRPRKPKEPRVPGAPKIKKPKTPRASKHGAQGSAAGSQQDTPMTMEGEVDDNTTSLDETMSILSAQSRSPTPSPLLGSRGADQSSSDISDNDTYSPGQRRQRSTERSPRSRKKQNNSQTSRVTASESTQSQYAETLLEYFVTDQTTLPSILTHPPPDLDFDLIIDEEGHTPLHWAVAMARIKIVKLLVQHGADIYRVNNQGQTALMRSVLFANNFDMKTFASLLEILQKTIFTIDKNDQTVFHHVAATAGMRGKVHASRYYMECLLDKLALHPSELASIINVQDVAGDTALIIAARIGNKKVVRLLLEAGADSKIRNKSGRNADEYLQEAENQASGSSSTLLPSLQPPTPVELGPAASLSGSGGSLGGGGGGGGGVRASQRMIPAVTELFEHLTQSYEKDLYEKEQDLLDARNLLHSIQSEVQEGHRTMDELRNKTMYLGQAEDQIRTLEGMIRQEIHLRQRLRLEDLVTLEENRLRREREMEKERTGHGPVDGGRVLAMEREAVELRASLSQMQQSRKEQVEQIVQLKSQQGKRRQEYKRLIALCCNVSIDEVDGLLGPLLNTLGNEDGVA
ncbi:apses-domain-containing protein [Linnemannia elongata]|nr:apses-domain-containing protein [Linnemannia elongata]